MSFGERKIEIQRDGKRDEGSESETKRYRPGKNYIETSKTRYRKERNIENKKRDQLI